MILAFCVPDLVPLANSFVLHAFYEKMRKNDTKKRIGGTVASSIYLMMQGVQILRVHEVNEILQGIKVFKNLIKN